MIPRCLGGQGFEKVRTHRKARSPLFNPEWPKNCGQTTKSAVDSEVLMRRLKSLYSNVGLHNTAWRRQDAVNKVDDTIAAHHIRYCDIDGNWAQHDAASVDCHRQILVVQHHNVSRLQICRFQCLALFDDMVLQNRLEIQTLPTCIPGIIYWCEDREGAITFEGRVQSSHFEGLHQVRQCGGFFGRLQDVVDRRRTWAWRWAWRWALGRFI